MYSDFNKGLTHSFLGSFWWGFLGVIYFKYIAFIGYAEIVIHRCLWTALTLIITTSLFSKWNIFLDIISKWKNIVALFFSAILVFLNWTVWIYAVATEKIIDASFGYYIMPILSVLLGYFFFKEQLNQKRIFCIILVIFSILFLLLISVKSLPWVGIMVAVTWTLYNLIRKKINVDTDVGLLVESLFILPFALVAFYFLVKNGANDFKLSDLSLLLIILLAGPMTVVPLFLYVKGVELSGLGPSGMIFFVTPTLQFLLGFYYYNEQFSSIKLLSFIFIWIAVVIYLSDIYETNNKRQNL
ncbi:EamA family transporter RarD [Alphaproteobacteria bacterium]|jgi:chloramphenicol-sensitive protein RarD|nr:EamA family transporter RarD [Alphaproteobacteria bacterium]